MAEGGPKAAFQAPSAGVPGAAQHRA